MKPIICDRTKRTLFVMLFSLFLISVSATEITVNGIVYDLSGNFASVLHVADGNHESTITIPKSIENNGLAYAVEVVATKAFCNNLYSPMSIGYLHYYYVDGVSYQRNTGPHPFGSDAVCEYQTSSIPKLNSWVRKVILPSTIKKIESGAFYNTNITDIELSDGITTIESYAFGRTLISGIKIPGSTINIGDYAFQESSIISIVIPESLITLGNFIFNKCNLLRSIFYLGKTAPTKWVATTETYVPDKTTYSSPSYTINNANVIEMITFNQEEFVYTGQSPTTTWTNNIEGYNTNLSMSTLGSEAGNHEDWFPVTFAKDGESFTTNVVYRYKINSATIKVKASNVSREYGEDNPTFALSYSGFVNGENESVLLAKPTTSTTATKSSDAGEYTITASGGNAKNYTFVYEPGTLTITKAPLSAKVDDSTKQYGMGNPAFTVSYNGLKNGETVPKWSEALKIETSATTQSDVGNYAITATGKPVNYNLPSIASGTLSITPAPLKIKANDATRLYYEPNPEFSYSCSGFVNNDNVQVITKSPTFNTDATPKSNVGRYEIMPSGAQAKNYDIAYKAGVLTINKRSLMATANSVSREYGEENPELTIAYEGFVNNENESVLSERPIASTPATKYNNVGTYAINLSGGASTNYDLTLKPGVLTINKAPLSVIVNDATREYGENNPTFTLRYEGLKLNETEPKLEKQISVVTTANIASPVGEYSITASDGVATNYQLSYNAGRLNITPTALTVTAFSKFRKYGEENPEFDYSTSSTKLSSDKFTTLPALTCSATKSSPVGTYDITVSGAVMPNYEISYVGGVLTIDKGILEISAKSYSRLYGEDNPVFEVDYSGFANNESETNLSVKPTITCRATKESSAGQYPILVSGAITDNYEIAYKDGLLTIDPCMLVISTKDYSRRYGEENPDFEISYQGFVNGENESNLLKKPDISCVANATTDVGEYPITISGAESDNYSFVYNNGKLTITVAEQEIVWEQEFENIQVGDQIELTAYATSGLPIEYILSDNSLASKYTASGKVYLDCLQGGTLVIRALQEGNNNYYAAVRKSKTINIVDPSGIETICIEALPSDAPVYDLMGNKVKVLIKGRIYIQNRKKFVAK